MKPNTINDFWERVNKLEPTECWNWTGGTIPQGYGYFSIKGRRTLAHILEKELEINRKIDKIKNTPGQLRIVAKHFGVCSATVYRLRDKR